MQTIVVNAMDDGTCRTIKSQYHQTSAANFTYTSTFGATGVMRIVNIKEATKQGYAPCKVGGVADLAFPTSKTRRGRVINMGDTSPTLQTTEQPCRIEDWNWEVDGKEYNIRIRKLTPRECWRLMDFTDEDFDKAQAVNSNTQLYKQAGNSICKSVIMELFRVML